MSLNEAWFCRQARVSENHYNMISQSVLIILCVIKFVTSATVRAPLSGDAW